MIPQPQPVQNIFAQRMGIRPQSQSMPTWGSQPPLRQMPVGSPVLGEPVRPVGPAMPLQAPQMAQPMEQPAWGAQPPITSPVPVQTAMQPNQGILQNPNVQNFLRQRMGMSY